MGSKDFKPCDGLSPDDFRRHPIWGFDLERAETDPEADETWVSPKMLKKLPKDTDVLFLGAELRAANGEAMSGAVLIRYEGGKLKVEGLALLTPRYCAAGMQGSKASSAEKDYLKKIFPKSSEWFPMNYTATLPVGSKTIMVSGTVT